MTKVYEFHAVLHPVPDKGGAYIIFPYAKTPISEYRLKKEFPKTYAYLDSYRDELAKRAASASVIRAGMTTGRRL